MCVLDVVTSNCFISLVPVGDPVSGGRTVTKQTVAFATTKVRLSPLGGYLVMGH